MGERMAAMPSAWSLGWLAYQTFWVVSLTYAVWFAMVQRYSASRLSAFTFLTPLFGVASGHFVLGEPISWVFRVLSEIFQMQVADRKHVGRIHQLRTP